MKFIFIDEFKPSTSGIANQKLFGLSAVMIDSAYYATFKKGFEGAFSKLGWTKEKELKGRYVYSKKIFENITINQRIKFAEDLFSLSASRTGKSKRISVFVSFNYFATDIQEYDIYINLLSRILKKIEKPQSAKIGKNLIAFFLDNNDAVTKKISESSFYRLITQVINRKWIVFERPFFINSSSLSPGLIFADFVSYFHQNFIDTRNFFNATKDRFINLLDNFYSLLPKEKEELKRYIINYNKQRQSSRIIGILKNIIYV